MRGSAHADVLEPVREALAQGRYERAFTLLERAARRARGRSTRAVLYLHLAGFYSLYGDDGLDDGSLALSMAADTDPGVVDTVLYRALYWEFAALGGEDVDQVVDGVADVPQGADQEAEYHAASALLAAGAVEEAAARLAAIDGGGLPIHLGWRRWSLLGMIEEQLGDFEAAAAAFERSSQLAVGPDRQLERLSLAASLVELRRGDDAAAVLAEVDEEQLELEDDLVQLRYLAGRAELERGNPNLALELLQEARTLLQASEPDHALLLAEGQVLAGLGRFDEAAQCFAKAVEAATPEQQPSALHELGLALIETGDFAGAEERLSELAGDLDYPFRAEALADLAETHFKLGDFDRAEAIAMQALELGATAAACFTLGSIDYEYFRLDEAATWFERAASASEPGDPLWVLSQQLLADVFAQKGPEMVERLVTHARAALAYTDPANEWFLPLKSYLEAAERQLGGNRRVLN